MLECNVVQLKNVPILTQLKWEEALLRTKHDNWCLINQGSPPAVVLGISGRVDELINLNYFYQNPIPLIRRFSGGGTVVVDENTIFVTFICHASQLSISPFPQHIMQWTEEFYRPIFPTHPFQLKENDYVMGLRKFGGNAQSITKNRWLHHSSLLWDFCYDKMQYLSLPKKRPHYRKDRSHLDFLCSLKDFCSDQSKFQDQLLNRLEQKFSLKHCSINDLKEISQIPHRHITQEIFLDFL
ncbi:lipoate--protein ligase family protein [Candidatus Protochlamydia amoebophila]|uniref:lipoate--protein ligase family protein n=1 Tax=Candidatus Protochlamydia amoebophila TaxID=362787 RepID=UPI00031D533D|nr:lipoate--protein ligase family protein [Candidatus Protochlamydia amoebophila]